jgi:DNA-binding MarR family transcriptional regulator
MDRWLVKALSVTGEIQRTAAELRALRESQIRQHNLNREWWAALLAVHDSSYCLSISDFARVMKLPRQSAHRKAVALARGGWVELRPNPDDRRLLQLVLTPNGRRAVATIRHQFSTAILMCAADVDGRTFESTEKLLRTLRFRIVKLNPPTGPRRQQPRHVHAPPTTRQ